ncbi:hypothetical protein [Buttiauxella agrestis]|uniref:hypothetical protein n=1 Tax=Buttiauxella agrestis TaxID=82977 RepID=UPI001560466B|nr:hypothetical protein [Buttiauxella agrestis]BCG08763.1 hypothetical protein BADSM9389_14220 [Buttiauxella agrestis]
MNKLFLASLLALTTTTASASQFAIKCNDGTLAAFSTDTGASQITVGDLHFDYGETSQASNTKNGYFMNHFATDNTGNMATIAVPEDGERTGEIGMAVTTADGKTAWSSRCHARRIR